MNRKLIYVNALGKSVTFNDYGLYIALVIEGLGEIPVQNEVQKAPAQDGATWLDAVFETRMVTVEGVINTKLGRDEIYRLRAELASILNPKLGNGTLTYYAGGYSVRMLRKAQPSLPSYPQREGNEQMFLVRFEGVDPYWYQTTYNVEELGGWEGGFEFPMVAGVETGFVFPMVAGVESGIEFERRSASAEMYLHNIGDYFTPIEIWAKGTMAQAQITNQTTGEFIRVNRAIDANEELYICTRRGDKKVLLTNLDTGLVTNAFGYLDRASTFWQLQVGANLVSYDATGSGIGTKVRVRYQNRFVGV